MRFTYTIYIQSMYHIHRYTKSSQQLDENWRPAAVRSVLTAEIK